MAWQYDDYITLETVSDRRSRLRLHIQEVSAELTAKQMSDGTAYDPTVLLDYRKELTAELDKIKGGGSRIARGRIFKK